MDEDDTFERLQKEPTWMKVCVATEALSRAIAVEDPEDTLMVQLTLPEIQAYSLGIMLQFLLNPELRPFYKRVMTKLQELSEAQEFFQRPDKDGAEDA